MAGTRYQREVLDKLRSQGFIPNGYDANGRLVVYHPPTGYATHLPTKPDRNLLARINRGVKKAEGVAAQFERWIWEKHHIPPGTEKRCALSLATEAKDFMRQADIHGIRPQSVVTQVKRMGNFTNQTGKSSTNGHGPDHMEDEGPARRIWLISQPELPEVVKPWVHEPGPLICPTCGSTVTGRTCVCGWYQGGVDEKIRAEWVQEQNRGRPAPPPDATEAMALGVQEKVEEAQVDATLEIFDPELVSLLKKTFGGPAMEEARVATERSDLMVEELTAHVSDLTKRIDELVSMRERLQSVLDVVQG